MRRERSISKEEGACCAQMRMSRLFGKTTEVSILLSALSFIHASHYQIIFIVL